MHPPKFDYYRAGTVDEAVALLQQHDGAKVLAGGHSLLPALKLRLSEPDALIDIGRIDGLKGITVNGDTVRIGAMTTHVTIKNAANLPAALSDAAGVIGDIQVRNRGTIGGNLAHADPASDYPPALLALGATINLVGPGGRRSVAAADFFLDLFVTALGEGELVESVEVGLHQGAGSAHAKYPSPASGYPLVNAAALLHISGGICQSATVAVGGLTPTARLVPSVAAALQGQALNEASIQAAAALVAGDLGEEVLGDIHASADYRRAMAPVYVARALRKAAERA